jgi:hypothetical protein
VAQRTTDRGHHVARTVDFGAGSELDRRGARRNGFQALRVFALCFPLPSRFPRPPREPEHCCTYPRPRRDRSKRPNARTMLAAAARSALRSAAPLRRALATHAPAPAPLAAPAKTRHDWVKDEIQTIYDGPLLDLVFRAAGVHRQHWDARQVQLCTLMNIKSASHGRFPSSSRAPMADDSDLQPAGAPKTVSRAPASETPRSTRSLARFSLPSRRLLLLAVVAVHDGHQGVQARRHRARPRRRAPGQGERQHALLHGRRLARPRGAQARLRAHPDDGARGARDGHGGLHDARHALARAGADAQGSVSALARLSTYARTLMYDVPPLGIF